MFDQSATRAIGIVVQSLICSKLNKSLKQDTWFIIYINLVRCRIVLWLVKYLQHVIIQKCESISIIIFVVFNQNISYCAINGIFNFNWNWINRIRVKACTEKTIVPHERQHNLLQGNFHLMGENWSNKCQSLNKSHKNFAIGMFFPFYSVTLYRSYLYVIYMNFISSFNFKLRYRYLVMLLQNPGIFI